MIAAAERSAVPRALQVHGDDLIELLLGHLAHRRVSGDAGVVDHDVQTAEALDRGGHQRVDLVGVGHIAAHGQRHFVAAELFGRRLGRTEVQIAQHHARTLGDEPLRDGESQALRTARDDGGLTGQQ